MRLVLPTLVTVWLAIQTILGAEGPSVQALLALKGEALFKAIDGLGFDAESKFPSDELVKIAEHLQAEVKNLPRSDDNRFLFGHFFEAACEKASAKEIDKLVAIYVRLEPSSFDKIFSFRPLAAAWIARELVGLEPTLVPISDGDEAVPPEAKNAPTDLLAAWQLYKRATRLEGPTFKFAPGKKEVSFQANEAAFYRLIDDAFLKRGERTAERLAEFGWSGGSGTGSDFLFDPQSAGIFIVLLTERRLPEAVRAAIEVESETVFLATEAKNDVRITFLKKCGLDWESIFAGALLDLEEGGRFGAWHNPYLKELASYGSDKAAKMVAALAQRAKPDFREDYAQALSAFISDPADLRYVSGRDFSRISRIPIGAEARISVLETLQRFATPEASSQVASIVLKALEAAKQPDTKESVRALLKHPSPEVAAHAARILQSMGERVEIPPVNDASVRFQVLLNRKPIPRGLEIDYEVRSGSAYRGSNTNVDRDGMILIERRLFLNPEQRPTDVVLRSRGGPSSADPYFWLQTPAPADLDKVIRANVEGLDVKLVFHRPQQTNRKTGSKAKVRFQRHEPKREKPDDNFVYFDRMPRDLELSLDQPAKLWIQKGDYDVEVVATGLAKLRQEFAVEGERPRDVSLRLEPGGDLRFIIVRPDGQRGAKCVLLRNGKELDGDDVDFDPETDICRGLPAGQYVLHIPASSVASKNTDFLDYAPLQGYVGRDVPFTISGEPPLVDLGEIHLKAP